MDFVIGVLVGLTVAAILAAIKWLSAEQHREDLWQRARQAVCRHDWRPADGDAGPDDRIVVIRLYDEICSKCGATRDRDERG